VGREGKYEGARRASCAILFLYLPVGHGDAISFFCVHHLSALRTRRSFLFPPSSFLSRSSFHGSAHARWDEGTKPDLVKDLAGLKAEIRLELKHASAREGGRGGGGMLARDYRRRRTMCREDACHLLGYRNGRKEGGGRNCVMALRGERLSVKYLFFYCDFTFASAGMGLLRMDVRSKRVRRVRASTHVLLVYRMPNIVRDCPRKGNGEIPIARKPRELNNARREVRVSAPNLLPLLASLTPHPRPRMRMRKRTSTSLKPLCLPPPYTSRRVA
jgi:hypothetical protein